VASPLQSWVVPRFRPLRYFAEAILIASAGLCAFLLRFEGTVPREYWRHLGISVAIWVVVKLLLFRWFGLDRRSWRFFSTHDAIRLLQANVVGSLISLPLLFLLTPTGFPRSVPVLDLILCALFMGGFAVVRRMALQKQSIGPASTSVSRPVVIYGAGQAGVSLLNEVRANPALGYDVIGFVDDDPMTAGMYVNNTLVLGAGVDLRSIAARNDVQEVLIAIPSASGDQMFTILQHCQAAGVRYRSVAALGEVVEGKGMAAQIRDVDVHDLLSRSPATLDHHLIAERIEGKIIMVTGAAGSIGAELCRQIARFRPAALVAFEIAETPLFYLDQQLRAEFESLTLHLEIGSIQNRRRIEQVIGQHRPSMIFHAAAYKHVPMMEANIFEAVENNVFGTLNVAEVARDYGVGEFVLISSDKAVRPTSVMGTTKRLCELLVLGLPSKTTRFVAVRFGNVLGSNGSVIPVFKQQIAEGGPVRVTHPDMRRYFMTIREAAQLVIQAAAMGRGGEIFVLDMGQQVKIVDLARKLIMLSGRVPDVDIKIEFSGTRPGEKLYEELNLDDERTVGTSHQKIKIFCGGEPELERLSLQTNALRRYCTEHNHAELMSLIQRMVPEYTPSNQALQQIDSPVPIRARSAAAGAS
jgi:FlaA1/EpsC-like NDP-sugar epimerase